MLARAVDRVLTGGRRHGHLNRFAAVPDELDASPAPTLILGYTNSEPNR